MKLHSHPIKQVLYGRVSLYFFAAILIFLSISGLATHIFILSDILLNSISIEIKLGHAKFEMARLIVLCILFSLLLLTRRPLNKKDVNFNTSCTRYGFIYLITSLILVAVYYLLNLYPDFFPALKHNDNIKAFFWPFVNIFYTCASVSFVYNSLRD